MCVGARRRPAPEVARDVQRPRVMRPTYGRPPAASDVYRLLGEVDPLLVDRVLATGASLEEIGEALRETQDEAEFGETPHPPSSGRVADVRAVREEILRVEEDDSEGY